MSSTMKDIVSRTNGELYIGVVGSVRSGKSTFIRKFMEIKVLPYVTDDKDKIIDELPQSSAGKMIMTVEPKFVPSSPANIVVENEINLNVRLVDCVGYVLKGAKGYLNEDGSYKLVKTPWFVDEIPFVEAATLGTRKVMENHSHIGIVITTDGSFTDFRRYEYEEVEKEIVEEMKKLNKPFVVIMNTKDKNNDNVKFLCEQLTIKYNVSVLPINVEEMTESDVDLILKEALNEFDITKLNINAPNWITNLSNENEIKVKFNNYIKEATGQYRKFKEVNNIIMYLKESELFSDVLVSSLDSGNGEVELTLNCSEELYESILTQLVGPAMLDKGEFIKFLSEAVEAKEEYAKYKAALESVKNTGYGISTPIIDEMVLDEPSIVKQGSRYGIKLRALAPSIHMIKVDVESTFEPIIGTEEQSNKLLEKIMSDYESDPNSSWSSEIFGRKLSEVVNDGVKAKLYLMPDDVQTKMRDCMEKIVNKGKGGLITIIL